MYMRTPVLRISIFISLLLAGVLSITALGICFGESTATPQKASAIPTEQEIEDTDFMLSKILVLDSQGEMLIDEAVATGDISFWLHHSIDKKPSIAGTPVLDERCSFSSKHLMIYGHHIGSNGMFGPIAKSFKPEVFNTIGQVKLQLINNEGRTKELIFTPYCAGRVLEDDQTIQQVSFADKDTYSDWLATIYKSSQTQGEQSPNKPSNAQALSLVTCSEDTPNQPWRCVLTCLLQNEKSD